MSCVSRRITAACLLVFLAMGPGTSLSQSSSPSAAGPGRITFEEVAAQSGIQFSIDSSPTPNRNQIETMVAGVALIDYDGDGYQDIFFVNAAAIPSLEKDGPQYRNRLYHNNHDGTFTAVEVDAWAARPQNSSAGRGSVQVPILVPNCFKLMSAQPEFIPSQKRTQPCAEH